MKHVEITTNNKLVIGGKVVGVILEPYSWRSLGYSVFVTKSGKWTSDTSPVSYRKIYEPLYIGSCANWKINPAFVLEVEKVIEEIEQ